MACPTCDHTMTCITNGVFWCNRCGTVSDFTQGITDHAAPKLVDRCREFSGRMHDQYTESAKAFQAEWRRLGLPESLYPSPEASASKEPT